MIERFGAPANDQRWHIKRHHCFQRRSEQKHHHHSDDGKSVFSAATSMVVDNEDSIHVVMVGKAPVFQQQYSSISSSKTRRTPGYTIEQQQEKCRFHAAYHFHKWDRRRVGRLAASDFGSSIQGRIMRTITGREFDTSPFFLSPFEAERKPPSSTMPSKQKCDTVRPNESIVQ